MNEPVTAQKWLLSKGRSASDLAELLSGFCDALLQDGIPIARATIGAPLLHPITQSSFANWSQESGARQNSLIWTSENQRRLRNSPILDVYENGRGERFDLSAPKDREKFAITRELADEGFSEYATFPLLFSDGSFKIFTWATRNVSGFSDKHINLLDATLPALSTIVETMSLRTTAETVLNTYVGRRAGKRVLDGDIHRGDGGQIPAVILFSDVRGFTSLSSRIAASELLQRLNVYFGLLNDRISENSGEVLKFIGDAVLAIFPYDDSPAEAVRCAEKAIEGILISSRAETWPEDLDFGIGLHLGDVFYGNVGGTDRLDFTVIGPTVNMASRIEGLCGVLSETVLVSQDIRDISARTYRDCGAHDLKGVVDPVRVFAPDG